VQPERVGAALDSRLAQPEQPQQHLDDLKDLHALVPVDVVQLGGGEQLDGRRRRRSRAADMGKVCSSKGEADVWPPLESMSGNYSLLKLRLTSPVRNALALFERRFLPWICRTPPP
jgi:hypothetical protein